MAGMYPEPRSGQQPSPATLKVTTAITTLQNDVEGSSMPPTPLPSLQNPFK